MWELSSLTRLAAGLFAIRRAPQAALPARMRSRGGLIGSRDFRAGRQRQCEAGASGGGALQVQIAAVSQGDLAHQGEAQSGAAGFGREEWLENPCSQLLGDAGSGIADGDLNVAA